MSDRSKAGGRGASAGSDKAWASGRVLTAEQRARKQEVDRKANRFLKREVQDRLAILEARVLELESTKRSPSQSQSSGLDLDTDDTVAANIHTPGPWAEQKDRKQSWSSVATTTNALSLTHHGLNGGIASAASGLDYGQAAQHESAGSTAASANGIPYSGGPEALFPSSMRSGPSSEDPEEFTHTVNGASSHSKVTSVYSAAKPLPNGRDLTLFLNNLVNHIRSIPQHRVCFDDQCNQDVLVNAVLKGWKYALSRYEQICPLWEVLQVVDLCMFKDCTFVDRTAMLRMLHKRYMYEIKDMPMQVEGPLPVWYQPQVSEQLIAHDPVIDHLTWPSLRERLLTTQANVLTNKFWASMARNLRVAWKFEPFDVMAFNPESSLYSLTGQFESSIMNMANWRMDVNFFYDFPGLVEDVPAANYMPLRTVMPRFGDADRPFEEEHQKRPPQLNGQDDLSANGQPRFIPVHGDEGGAIFSNPIRPDPTASWNGFLPFGTG